MSRKLGFLNIFFRRAQNREVQMKAVALYKAREMFPGARGEMTGGLCTKPPCRPPRAAQVPQWLPLKCRGGLLQATLKYSQTGIWRIRNPLSRQYQQINIGGRVKSSMIDTTYANILFALLEVMRSTGMESLAIRYFMSSAPLWPIIS